MSIIEVIMQKIWIIGKDSHKIGLSQFKKNDNSKNKKLDFKKKNEVKLSDLMRKTRA